MPNRDTLAKFLQGATEQMQKPVREYYSAVRRFGADSVQATIAQSLAKAELERTVRQLHVQAAVIGGGGQLSGDAKAILKDIIGTDTYYVERFATALPKLNEAQAMSRASMYASTQRNTITDIVSLELPTLPVYPKSSSLDCKWHCKCAIDARFLFGEGNIDVYWLLDQMGGIEHCQDCLRLARTWKPLRIRDGKITSVVKMTDYDFAVLKQALERAA